MSCRCGAMELLLNAAKVDDVAAIRRLAAEGTDVNVKDVQETTPLHCAAHHGHVDAVRVLEELGVFFGGM
jgi:ankyrin repeat protein